MLDVMKPSKLYLIMLCVRKLIILADLNGILSSACDKLILIDSNIQDLVVVKHAHHVF